MDEITSKIPCRDRQTSLLTGLFGHVSFIWTLKLFLCKQPLLSLSDNLGKQFGPDLDRKCLKKLIMKKAADDIKSMKNYQACKKF